MSRQIANFFVKCDFMNFCRRCFYIDLCVFFQVDKNYAIQLEDTIGNADLEAFVCVNERDMNKLMNKLRKDQKLRNINVVQVPKEIKNYTHPQINTRDTGKMVFLDDIIRECPQNVKRLLCEKKKLHMTPVFEKEPRETPTNVTKFYVNKTKHQIFGSKYACMSCYNVFLGLILPKLRISFQGVTLQDFL